MSCDSSPRLQATTDTVPIAIIGMGGLFPKAQNLKEFWSTIRNGIDAISDIPSTHWNADDYFDANITSPDKTYSKRGGFLSSYPFDPLEFGIPPNALEATDTAQLLGLVAARAALEDAGYGQPVPNATAAPTCAARPAKAFNRDKVSVILGVTGTLELVIPLGARLGHPLWRKALQEAGLPEAQIATILHRISEGYVPWQENSFPGLLGNVVAGRIANRLDLGGTNCVVDAACASSLSAAHLAIMELASGRAEMVVTGGVDTFNDIFMFMCFSKTPALSPSGSARPFDAAADGTSLGEGIGMMVLKRLDAAERDNDRIYAVIQGLGTSSDGRSKSIYAPRSEGQAKALRSAYKCAGISPSTIDLVEAHGTGTKAGDLAEFEALREVYQEAQCLPQQCALGSIKSQIGHTKAAAGAAGLMKAALALHHKVLPPTLKISVPNPKLALESSPFYLNTESRPWPKPSDHPRRAAVSAFGFGGSNFHIVLEEYRPTKSAPSWDGSIEIVALQAATAQALGTKLEEWAGFLRSNPLPVAISKRAWESRHEFAREDKENNKANEEADGKADDKPNKSDRTPRTPHPTPYRATFVLRLLELSNLSQIASELSALAVRAKAETQSLERFSGGSKPHNSTAHSPSSSRFIYLSDNFFSSSPGYDVPYSDSTSANNDNGLTPLSRPPAPPIATRRIIALFPGQGSQYVGMGRELACIFPEFLKVLEQAEAARPGLLAKLYPRATFTEAEQALQAAALLPTREAQPALAAVSLGWLRVLQRFGVQLEGAAGHSFGELTALCAAGYFDSTALLQLACARGEAMAHAASSAPTPGAMLAVRAPLAQIEALLVDDAKHLSDIVLANRNSPTQGVLSGPVAAIALAEKACQARGWSARRLDVAAAFHTTAVATAVPAFAKALASIPLGDGNSPTFPVWANSTGQPYPSLPGSATHSTESTADASPASLPSKPIATETMQAEANAALHSLLANQLAQSVRFCESLQAIAAEGPAIFIEIGPKAVLTGLARETLAFSPELRLKEASQAGGTKTDATQPFNVAKEGSAARLSSTRLHPLPTQHSFISCNASGAKGSSLYDLAQTLAQLAALGVPVTLDAWEPEGNAGHTPTPGRLIVPICGANYRSKKIESESRSTKLNPQRESKPEPELKPNLQRECKPELDSKPKPKEVQTDSFIPVRQKRDYVTTQKSENANGSSPQLALTVALPYALSTSAAGVSPSELLTTQSPPASPLSALPPSPSPSRVLANLPAAASSQGFLSSQTFPRSTPTIAMNASPSGNNVIAPPHVVDAKPLVPESQHPTQHPIVPQPQRHTGASGVLELAHDAFSATQESLRALHSLSMQTAALHQKFLDGQESAHRAFHHIFEQQRRIVERAMGIEPTALAAPSLSRSTPYHTEAPVVAPRSPLLSTQTPLEPDDQYQYRALQDAQKQPLAARAQSPGLVSPSQANGHSSTLPPDFANNQNGHPGANDFRRATIAQAPHPIASFVPQLVSQPPAFSDKLGPEKDATPSGHANGSALVAPALADAILTSAPAPKTNETTTAAKPLDTLRLQAILLEVVAEKTGYPQETLAIDLDFESDLGIDSIKRVEILAGLREKMPEAPSVEPEHLGSLRTLRDIITFISKRDVLSANTNGLMEAWVEPAQVKPSQIASVSSSANSVEVESATGSGSSSNASLSNADYLAEILLEVVADKTGYPRETLGLDMDLESDLGIDSIKRVEILAGMRQRAPEAPSVEPEHLGELRTLRHILNFLTERMEPPAPPPPRGGALVPEPPPLSIAQGAPAQDRAMANRPQPSANASTTDRSFFSQASRIPAVERRELIAVAIEPSTAVVLRVAPGHEVWIAGGDEALGQQLVLSLKQRGVAAFFASLEEALVTSARPIPTAGLIILGDSPTQRSAPAALDARSSGSDNFLYSESSQNEPWPETSEHFLKQAFLVLKKCASDLRSAARKGGSFVATISQLGGRFGLDFEKEAKVYAVADPVQGGLSGLAKTVATEWPGVVSLALDIGQPQGVPSEVISSLADALIDEIAVHRFPEIGLFPTEPFPTEPFPTELLPTEFRSQAANLATQNHPKQRALFRSVHLQLRTRPYEQLPQLSAPWTSDDVIVITGGARGVTAAAAVALAETFAAEGIRPAIVLLGRSAAPQPEPHYLHRIVGEAALKRALLEAARAQGEFPTPKAIGESYRAVVANREITQTLQSLATLVRADYMQADVRDFGSVSAAVASIRARYGAITGLVHGAGLLEDKRIEDKTESQFNAVFETKVTGLRTLLAATGADPLRALVLFSSVSGRFGRRGQIDYAMANEVLNKVAQREARLRSYCRVVSLNWGPWAGGMVTPGLQREFEKEGVGLIPLEEGALAFVAEFLAMPSRDKSNARDAVANTVANSVEIVLGSGLPEVAALDSTLLPSAQAPMQAVAIESQPSEKRNATPPYPLATVEIFAEAVSLTRYPVLASHCLSGRAVVPLALMVEWFAHAAQLRKSGRPFVGLHRVKVLKGMILDLDSSEEAGKATIRVLAGEPTAFVEKREAMPLLAIPLELVSSVGRVHARAIALLADHAEHADRAVALDFLGPSSSSSPARAIPALERYRLSTAEVYRTILFHGPALQGLRTVDGIAREAIVAHSRLAPPPTEWLTKPYRASWITDPMLIDAAFQLAIVWCHEYLGAPCLPARFDSLICYMPFPVPVPTAADEANAQEGEGTGERVKIIFSIESSTEHSVKGAVSFVSQTGALIATIEGFEGTVDPSLKAAFRVSSASSGSLPVPPLSTPAFAGTHSQ